MGSSQSKRGIFYILFAIFSYSCADAVLKALAVRYPVNQLLFIRSGFSMVVFFGMLALQKKEPIFATFHRRLHIMRGVIGALAMFLILYSFTLLPLAEAISLNFTVVFFITALSFPLLGERVGIHRWLAIFMGFAGVLILAGPCGFHFDFPIIVAISGAFLSAISALSGKMLTRTESPTKVAFYNMFICTLLCAVSLLFSSAPLETEDLPWFFLLGVGGTLGTFFTTKAYSYAPASVIGPMIYSHILWATMFGYLLWGEVPRETTFIGAFIIILSGLYIAYREKKLGKIS